MDIQGWIHPYSNFFYGMTGIFFIGAFLSVSMLISFAFPKNRPQGEGEWSIGLEAIEGETCDEYSLAS